MVVKFTGLNQFSGTEKEKSKIKFLREIKPHIVEDEQFESFFSDFDWDLMTDLISSEYTKSGGDKQKLKILKRDEIIFIDNKTAREFGIGNSGLAYSPENDLIIFNVERLREMHKGSPLDILVMLTEQLFHEEGHFVDAGYFKRISDTSLETSVGVEQSEIINMTMFRRFNLLNEAITDLRARKQALEYFRRKQPDISKEKLDWLEDIYNNPLPDLNFFTAIHILHEISEKIKSHVGLTSKEEVVNAMIHSAYNGLQINDKETKIELNLDGIFGKGFTNDLKDLQLANLTGMKDFIKKYKLTSDQKRFSDAIDLMLKKHKK